jgi:hypothetical protein
LKKLGNLVTMKKPGKSKSGDDLEAMQQHIKSEPRQKEERASRRRSKPTNESNKEKLKSFKEMIASSNKGKETPESSRRRSESKNESMPPIPSTPRRSSASTSTSPSTPPGREPSLSPEVVKKPASSSYITGFLDKLYDSYMKEDDGSDEESDDDGYGKPQGLLDMSLTKFADWAG